MSVCCYSGSERERDRASLLFCCVMNKILFLPFSLSIRIEKELDGAIVDVLKSSDKW